MSRIAPIVLRGKDRSIAGGSLHHPFPEPEKEKKNWWGNFKAPGAQWRPKGRPAPVRVRDFIIPANGKAIPYGVYDLTRNAGWVSIGIDHDTASFAARTIRRWWQKMGRPRYRRARSLLITADAGGSKWPAGAPVEVGTATAGQPDQPGDHHLPLPAGHQQLE